MYNFDCLTDSLSSQCVLPVLTDTSAEIVVTVVKCCLQQQTLRLIASDFYKDTITFMLRKIPGSTWQSRKMHFRFEEQKAQLCLPILSSTWSCLFDTIYT